MNLIEVCITYRFIWHHKNIIKKFLWNKFLLYLSTTFNNNLIKHLNAMAKKPAKKAAKKAKKAAKKKK